MIRKISVLISVIVFFFSCHERKDQIHEYPLYSPFFGSSHNFSGEELRKLAMNFDFIYGQAPSRNQMDSARKINPKIRFITYINESATAFSEAEKVYKRSIVYYPFAILGTEINETTVSFRLDPFPGSKNVILKSSTTEDPVTKNSKDYVIWIRIGNEMMRVVQWSPKTGIVKVERNFDGINLSGHRKGDVSCLPVYHVAPDNVDEYGDPSKISYHFDPASSARWDKIYSRMIQFINDGGDGIWIDILSDGCFTANDIEGKGLSMRMLNGKPALHSYWNYVTDTFYLRDDFRQNNEKGVTYLHEKFSKEFGRPALIYGNNMQATKFEPGLGGCKYYLTPTEIKPVPVNGMCIEDFMGGYTEMEWNRYRKTKEFFTPEKACYNCTKQYKNWILNLQMLANCSQNEMAAIPLIINAGMKTAQFEGVPRHQRHEWELWAYASYLIGVEKKNGVCLTKLGIPMFYSENGKRFVDIDPIYYLRIGEPVETFSPEYILNYRESGTEIFARNFSGGMVMVNPSDTEYKLKLERPLYDPDSGEKISDLTMSPQSGKILLKKL